MQRVRTVVAMLFVFFSFSGSSVAQAAIDAIEGKWKQVFAAEFDSPNDLRKWNIQTSGKLANHELNGYDAKAIAVKDGCLYVEAAKREVTYGGKAMHYCSGSLNTKGKFDRQFGRFDIRLKVPKGKGINPVFLIQTEAGATVLQISDVAGKAPSVSFTSRLGADKTSKGKGDKLKSTAKPDFSERFQEITAVWTADQVDYYVDGKKRASSQQGIPAQKLYMTIKLAIGGDGEAIPDAQSKLPASLAVDYVRVYEIDKSTKTSSAAKSAAKTPAKK